MSDRDIALCFFAGLVVLLLIRDIWYTIHTDAYTLIRWISEFPKWGNTDE